MANFIKNILGKFGPGNDKRSKKNNKEVKIEENSGLTNKMILTELTEHFKTMLNKESVGDRMLYPMAFNVLMDKDDYENRKQAFPFVLPEVVKSFYKVIKSKRAEYCNYEPPATYWVFKFSGCESGDVPSDSSMPLLVRKGHLTTVASLFSFSIYDAKSNTSVETNTSVSIKLDMSNVMTDQNVNWNAIKGLDVISEGSFTFKFDPGLGEDSAAIVSNSNTTEVTGMAELTYTLNGKIYHYVMQDMLIDISGNKETRKGRKFFVVDSPAVKDSHVQIKYLQTENKFQIAAFGKARLNGKALVESSGVPVWFDLANNSNILLQGDNELENISVKFKIK